MEHLNIPPANHVKVLDGQGWVGLIDHLGSEATIVNAARVSFGKLKSEMDARDVRLLEYLISNRHTSPLEHMVFTFSVHCPLFVRGQWHRHRTWSYNEISRRYTEIDLEFYTPGRLRRTTGRPPIPTRPSTTPRCVKRSGSTTAGAWRSTNICSIPASAASRRAGCSLKI